MSWMDWSPRASKSGSCQGVPLSITVLGVGISASGLMCEQWNIYKYAAGGHFKEEWSCGCVYPLGQPYPQTREVDYMQAISIPGGGGPRGPCPPDSSRSRKDPMRTSALAAAILVLAGLAGCGGASFTPPPIPSQEAAIGYFQTVLQVVHSGDLTSLCSLGGGTCPHDLQAADPAALPRTDPTVIGSRVLAPVQRPDGSWDIGGRVLELCGHDGRDRPYYAEILVFQDGNRLISQTPVFWTGVRVANGGTVGGASPQPSPCPVT